MTEYPHCKYVLRKIKLKHEYLVNNEYEKLVTKVNEKYISYQPEQRGGPLFFKIMLYVLQDTSAETAKYLVRFAKNVKITEYDRENFETVVSIIHRVVSCLRNLVEKVNYQTISPVIYLDSSRPSMTAAWNNR